MSLFLGKIHYWLFNKIQWFESLEKELLIFAEKDASIPVNQWKKEIYSTYGEPLPNKPLEDMIDTSNIHGWLQAKISNAEKRHAAWITKILSISEDYKKPISNIFQAQGKLLGVKIKEQTCPNAPNEMFNILNDFLLEGMPCDRVTEEYENTSELYSFLTTSCLHAPYWKEVGGDVENFHMLRTVWIKAFITALNPNFSYEVQLIDGKRLHKISRFKI